MNISDKNGEIKATGFGKALNPKLPLSLEGPKKMKRDT